MFKIHSRIRPLAILGALALSLPCAPAAFAECRIDAVAELRVTMAGLRPTVHAKVDGLDATFVLDTGAFNSVLSPAASQRFELEAQFRPDLRVEGVGGRVQADVAYTSRVELGGAVLRDLPFVVVDGAGDDVAGVLGANILPGDDVEFDLANRIVRYLKPHGCTADDMMAYWTDRASSLPLVSSPSQLSAQAMLNGHAVRVQFDTGAAHSGMTLPAAARAGLTPDSPGVLPATGVIGIGDAVAPAWVALFDRFSIGAEDINNARLRISRADLGDNDMVLGADFFLAHRVYVSRLQRRIYFTYNGGPVFRRDVVDSDVPNDDAGGFRQRSAALLAHDLEQVIEGPQKRGLLSDLFVSPPQRCLPAKSPPDKDIPEPKIVSTYPAQGAVVRPGVIVMRVTFDLPMTCEGRFLGASPWRDPCPGATQDLALSFDRRTIRTVCNIAPDSHYGVRLNAESRYVFTSLAGRPSSPFTFSFSTSSQAPINTVREALAEDAGAPVATP